MVTGPVAAEALGVNVRTIYRRTRAGKIPTVTFNGRRYIPAAWLADQLGVDVDEVAS